MLIYISKHKISLCIILISRSSGLNDQKCIMFIYFLSPRAWRVMKVSCQYSGECHRSQKLYIYEDLNATKKATASYK